MGMLINGTWLVDDAEYRNSASGSYVRPESPFRHWVRASGTSDFKAEPNRYQLLVAHNCPWAHRTAIARRVKGLDSAIDIIYACGAQTEQGWPFDIGVKNGPSPASGETMPLHQVYTAAKPEFSGRVTVPTLWDTETRSIVNNESADIVRMLDSEFAALSNDAQVLRPASATDAIDAINEWVYRDINNGVYRCGFAQTQAAYEEACEALFSALDRAEAILHKQRYLAGNEITEADVRLFPTLVRFDVVYYGLFKCNLRHLWDYPNLLGYVRDLYALRGFGDTTDLDAIKRGYYQGIKRVNTAGLVPIGPTGVGIDFTAPHDRATRSYPASS